MKLPRPFRRRTDSTKDVSGSKNKIKRDRLPLLYRIIIDDTNR